MPDWVSDLGGAQGDALGAGCRASGPSKATEHKTTQPRARGPRGKEERLVPGLRLQSGRPAPEGLKLWVTGQSRSEGATAAGRTEWSVSTCSHSQVSQGDRGRGRRSGE